MYKKTNTLYDGDWLNDERHGYGVLTKVVGGELIKEYAGGWMDGRKHVRSVELYDSCFVVVLCFVFVEVAGRTKELTSRRDMVPISMGQKRNTRGSGGRDSGVDGAGCIMLMGQSLKENGLMISGMGEDCCCLVSISGC